MKRTASPLGRTQVRQVPASGKAGTSTKAGGVGTQYPSQGAAQDAEMSLREYEDFVFGAGLLDHPDPVAAWKQISERQKRLVADAG